MGDLTDDFKLSFRSTGEINEVFSAMVARTARDREIRFRAGGKPNRAAVLNAIVLWLAAQPPADQKRIIGDGMARLNALLGYGDAAAPTPGYDQAATVYPPSEAAPKSRKKQSG